MTNLENLRMQAKQIVRWHRDRVWTVADVIRAVLPRFRELSDREILDAEFKLADAQELVARRAGYESWQALLDSMPASARAEAAEPSPARLLEAHPLVFVRDIRSACAFYAQTLGFEIGFTYGEPPFYAEIVRDEVRLALRSTDAPVIDPELTQRNQLFSASFIVEQLKELYLDYQRAGARFYQTLRTEPYGVRTFVVEDLDGNLLLFNGRLDPSS